MFKPLESERWGFQSNNYYCLEKYGNVKVIQKQAIISMKSNFHSVTNLCR